MGCHGSSNLVMEALVKEIEPPEPQSAEDEAALAAAEDEDLPFFPLESLLNLDSWVLATSCVTMCLLNSMLDTKCWPHCSHLWKSIQWIN